jgi:hypothetical protein
MVLLEDTVYSLPGLSTSTLSVAIEYSNRLTEHADAVQLQLLPFSQFLKDLTEYFAIPRCIKVSKHTVHTRVIINNERMCVWQ